VFLIVRRKSRGFRNITVRHSYTVVTVCGGLWKHGASKDDIAWWTDKANEIQSHGDTNETQVRKIIGRQSEGSLIRGFDNPIKRYRGRTLSITFVISKHKFVKQN